VTLTVYIEKPSHVSYGEAMGQIRSWLDYRKVETSGFKFADGRTGFEITFSSPDGAARFQDEFAWSSPPQATPPELGPAEAFSPQSRASQP
jgi:hypothetical protein